MGQTIMIVHSETNMVQPHETVLNVLDRPVGGVNYPKEAFMPTVTAWDHIPVVFATQHPDLDAFSNNQAKELARINGRLVGEVQSPRIEVAGHARLMANLALDSTDQQVQNLHAAGKLSLSTAFKCGRSPDGSSIAPTVVPNHVLVFEETPKDQPRDPGSMMLNKKETDMEQKNLGKELSAANAKELGGVFHKLKNLLKRTAPEVLEDPPADTETLGNDPEEQQEADVGADGNDTDDQGTPQQQNCDGKPSKNQTNKEIEQMAENQAVEAKNKELAAKDAEIMELKNKLSLEASKVATYEKAAADAAWQEVKNMLPPGLTHKEKDVEMRTLWEKNPTAILKLVQTNKVSASGHVEGVETLADDSQGFGKMIEQKNSRAGMTVGGCVNGEWK